MSSLDINMSLHDLNLLELQIRGLFNYSIGTLPTMALVLKTPGIMSMIPHLEQYYGTYFPDGGMHTITKSLHQLAKDLGVNFHFNTKVEKILVKNRKAIGIKTKISDILANYIISNSDIVPTYRNLLSDQKAPEKILKQPRSSSALIFYWGITKEFPELNLHNIFFSRSYRKEFDAIFNQNTVFDDPTIYVNITSKEAAGDAPVNCENWFVMINTPSNTGQDWDEIVKRSRENIQKKLSRLLGQNIADFIAFESVMDPRGIENNKHVKNNLW